MYQYFLGAFGNRSFIRPSYEIMEDGSLREIEDRWTEFPNGGTVSLSIWDNDTNDIRNRILKFKIDFNRDLHPNYVVFNDNSNKFQIPLSHIEDLDYEEIIEIIDIECSIGDFLNDKSKRTIKIKHLPNKLLLLRNGQDCFGPFEYIVSDVEDAYGDEAFYTLKIIVCSGIINRYKLSDLQGSIYTGHFSIRRNDQLQFIQNYDKLRDIVPIEEIEYFDNEELADFFKNLIGRSGDIDQIAELREKFLQVVDTFGEEGQLSDKRIQRICDLLQTSEELSEYKVKLLEEYFKQCPTAQEDKREYLRTHEELLESIVREDIHYEEKCEVLKGDIIQLEEEKNRVSAEIAAGREELSSQKKELEKFSEQVINQKKQEIEETLASQRAELKSVKESIEKAKQECVRNESDRDFWKKQCDTLRDECNAISADINTKIIEWAAENRKSEIIRLLVSQLEMPEEDQETSVEIISNINNELTADEIATLLIKKLSDAGRSISKDEAFNYLISIVQNYITVFAGEPGTGKTSLCKLLAKALGLYDERFAEILVERGWTSSRDLVGYYNPLTKTIEETQPRFSACLKQLNYENKMNMVEAPYFVLLDEVNLSPIEFYWSNFNYYCDDPSRQTVMYANGDEYRFGAELKFLATINYDQTTADLSPRFLDRAWVISMNPISVDSVVGGLTTDTDTINGEKIVGLSVLNKVFNWYGVKDKKLNQITKNRLDRIVDKMKEGGHSISARSLHAITHYYLVAEQYMTSKEVALDFAIAQKILPIISGNGKKYGEFLNGLMGICKENQLNRSAGIISKIIEKSEHDFFGFFSI